MPPPAPPRPEVRGKFLWRGDEKLLLKGVTYGTFRPGDDGLDFPPPEQVAEDFEAIAASGFNTVRVYTVPPAWLLDEALRCGLLVMVGLPWEQHVAFLGDRRRARSIVTRVREGVRACAGHPAVLCYAIGNEIPASIVRWHGRRHVERFVERLYRAAKAEDPEGLVTYVNFPTTEYLELPFLDLCCFNVYLEDEGRLEAYLARLQVLADDRPLVMAEIGLDSRRNGEEAQADALEWQLRTVFRAGAAGAMVFAWTDEWHRGGFDVDDWDFGLVGRDRSPKAALAAVRGALAELPVARDRAWPRVSVVICTHNGAATLDDALTGTAALAYPDFEVVVVDDGSTDASARIARAHGARVISTENRGLSSARNTGLEAATGEIVAYLDDDARPDPDWLTHLAIAFTTTGHAAVGGPNLPPPGDGPVADCVANAPGGPVHVLVGDSEAEHIPGCNMAFRAASLREIGGFDTRFHVAGDDVDVCWRLEQRGWTIGFSHAAMVWHHRRRSLRAFYRQQRGYGKAEAMLERKWPAKYNRVGHVRWRGRIYATGRKALFERWRVYYGTWGTGFFQRLYHAPTSRWAVLPLMPEWFILVGALAALAALGALWSPLLVAAPLLVVAVATMGVEAWLGARRARFPSVPRHRRAPVRLRALTAVLYLVQAFARLRGRVGHGLAPWGRRVRCSPRPPIPRTYVLWSECWQAVEDRLGAVERCVRELGARVTRGQATDRWDLQVRGGGLGSARVRMAVEEHGGGREQVLFRVWPAAPPEAVWSAGVCSLLATAAALDGAWEAAAILAAAGLGLLAVLLAEAAGAGSLAWAALRVAQEALERRPAALSELDEASASLRSGDAAGPAEVGDLVARVRPGETVGVVRPGTPQRRTLAEVLVGLQRTYADDGRTTVGVVHDGSPLLPLTVAENIALGRPGASLDDIRRAAETAGADRFIRRLPKGYNFILEAGGVTLTAQQRRQLLAARTFLQDPELLVVAGSAVERDGGLPEELRRLARGRRTLVVGEGPMVQAGGGRVLVLEDRHNGRDHGRGEGVLSP